MDLTAQQPLVLLAETDALIGIDLSDALEQAGYRVIGPLATSREALAALEQERPAIAIVDVVLRDGVCTTLGGELRQRGVPFLVYSSLQKQDELPAVSFQNVPWLSKPALPGAVVALVNELVSWPTASLADETGESVRLVPPVVSKGNPLIRKLEGFVTLSDADRAILNRISANPRLVGPQVDLAREGDAPEGVFLVMSGMAYRHKLRANGARQIMAYLVPGDLCDLDVALLSAMDHSITTVSACEIVRLTPETVADLLANHPQIARGLRKAQLVDEATLREWLANVCRRSALERLAHLFCELLLRMRAVGLASNDSYELPVTQTDLADTTGLTPVHVNRTLQELREQGLIELRSRRLKILDLPRLRSLAEFRPNYLHLGDQAAA